MGNMIFQKYTGERAFEEALMSMYAQMEIDHEQVSFLEWLKQNGFELPHSGRTE